MNSIISSKSRKIAEIVCTFHPYKGGIGNVALDNTKTLLSEGHDVVVFTPRYKKVDKSKDRDIKVQRLIPFFKFGNAAILPQLFWKLKDFDIVHLHYPFFGTAEIVWIIKKFLKRDFKLIVSYHMEATGSGLIGRIFDLYSKYLMPQILNSADKIIVSSMDYANNSEIKELVKSNNKIVEIPYGVDLDRFQPRARDISLMEQYRIKENEKMILFVGGLDKAHYFKGVPKMIKAFHNFKIEVGGEYRLLIVGDGDERFGYEQIAFDYGLRDKVIFAGRISDNDLMKYYNLADLLVLPSINKGEAFGIVLIEAMASGIPVIASNLPGVRSVVENGINGLIVDPGNTDDLKNKIKYLMERPEKLRSFGLESRRIAREKYNKEDLAKKFNKIFNE